MSENTSRKTYALSAAGISALLVAAFALLTGGQRAQTLGLTAHGDMVVATDGGAADVVIATRLPAGSAGYILRSISGTPTWRELSSSGTLASRPACAAGREGQRYYATDAAAGLELSECVHKGGATYAWEIVSYGVTAHDVTTRHGELAVRVDAGGADVTALAAVDPGTTGQVLTVSDAGLPHWAAASGGTPWGSTVVDDPGDSTGWTVTPAAGVTVSRAGSVLTLAAAVGTTGTAIVTRDVSPLTASATSWDVAVRLDVTAGGGMGSPRGVALIGFYTDAINYSITTLRSDRYVGLFVSAAGSFTNVAEVAGPSSGDITGGQLWLRNQRDEGGRFIAWWGVGVDGELPTQWRRIAVRDDTALTNALGTTRPYVGAGAYGEGAIGSAWTVDVLAIRTTSVGSL